MHFSFKQDGDRFWRIASCYIRGNTIKYLRIPDEIIDGSQGGSKALRRKRTVVEDEEDAEEDVEEDADEEGDVVVVEEVDLALRDVLLKTKFDKRVLSIPYFCSFFRFRFLSWKKISFSKKKHTHTSKKNFTPITCPRQQ